MRDEEILDIDANSFMSVFSNSWEKVCVALGCNKLAANYANMVKESSAGSVIATCVDIALNALLPMGPVDDAITGSIAAYDFLFGLLTKRDYDMTMKEDKHRYSSQLCIEFQNYFRQQLFYRLRSTICNYNEASAQGHELQRFSFSIGLIADLLETGDFPELVMSLESLWEDFGNFISKLCESVICRKGGMPKNFEDVVLFEVMRLWKLSLLMRSRSERNRDCLSLSVLLETLHRCLVEIPERMTVRWSLLTTSSEGFITEGAAEMSSFRLLDATCAHILVRSLWTVSKLMFAAEEAEGRGQSQCCRWQSLRVSFDSLLAHLIVGSGPDCAEPSVTTGSLAMSLAAANAPEQPVRAGAGDEQQATVTIVGLCQPDPGASLRLVLLMGLQLALRSLDNTDSEIAPLLSSLRRLVTSSSVHRPEAISDGPRRGLGVLERNMLHLLSGDDAHLFQGMYYWLQLANRTTRSPHLVRFIPSPHHLFCCLAATIDYQAYALVDWLTSPETDCLTYLVHYLRLFRCTGSSVVHLSDRAEDQLPHTLSSDWPWQEVVQMLRRTRCCLSTLQDTGGLPFSPKPLLRSIDNAVAVLSTAVEGK